MMTLKRFRALTRSYGADLQRWPREERGAARALSDSSEEARALLEQELLLDEAIAVGSAHQDAQQRPRGVQDAEHGLQGAQDAQQTPQGRQDAALARLRSGVAARIVTDEAQAKPAGRPGWLLGGASRASSVRMRRFGLATGAAFAIIAGLLVGGLYGPAPAPVGALSALLQPATLDILADEL